MLHLKALYRLHRESTNEFCFLTRRAVSSFCNARIGIPIENYLQEPYIIARSANFERSDKCSPRNSSVPARGLTLRGCIRGCDTLR